MRFVLSLEAVTRSGWFSWAPAEIPDSEADCSGASSGIGAGLEREPNVGSAFSGLTAKSSP